MVGLENTMAMATGKATTRQIAVVAEAIRIDFQKMPR